MTRTQNVLLLLALAGTSACAHGPPVVSPTPRGGHELLISAFGSGSNAYKRGNVDDFTNDFSQGASPRADQGAPSFRGFEVAFISIRDTAKKSGMGLGVQLVKGAPHAIWGSHTYFGGRTEVYFDVLFASLIMPIRQDIGSSMVLVIEPGITSGIMNGQYRSTSQLIEYKAAVFGGQGAIGVDLQLFGGFAAFARVGYRSARADAMYKDSTSKTGYSQSYCCGTGTELVVVDWSGQYSTLGLSLAWR